MEIRKTTIDDLDKVLKIYENARAFMAANGNPNQWGSNRPSKDDVISDIENGLSYVCLDEGKIVGTFYFNIGIDETYIKIENGSWISDDEYGVVHRIAADGKAKGIGSFCLNWAYSHINNIRIDTHRDNIPMQNMLKKNGFKYCGIIHIEDGSERMAFQKC